MQEKEDFLRHEYIPLLGSINPEKLPAWGKRSFAQMVEHMSDSFMIANGKDPKDCITPAEHLNKMQAFLMSDKPFRENTLNPQVPETPLPPRFDDVADSIGELEMQVADFFDLFDQDHGKIVTNPFYGDLNYEKWVHLLYKHAWHHLRQFGMQQVAL